MDKEILGSVSGLSLEFSNNKQPHYHKGMEMRFSSKEELFSAYVIKNVIKESQHEKGAFISSIFFMPKSEDSFRMILNLKRLNEKFKTNPNKSVI